MEIAMVGVLFILFIKSTNQHKYVI